MGKIPRYIKIAQREDEKVAIAREGVDRHLIGKKINKMSNLQLLELYLSDSKMQKYISTDIYRSNPSYESWRQINSLKGDVFFNTLKTLLTISDSFMDYEENMSLIENINKFKKSFVRPLEDWRPKSRNAHQQGLSLLRHLFVLYPTPSFLEKAFFGSLTLEGSNSVNISMILYIHMGCGKSLKEFKEFPEQYILPNKCLHHLYTASDDTELYVALRRCQILYMGGDEYIFKSLMRSGVLRAILPVVKINGELSTAMDTFWITVMKFFIENRMIPPNKIAEIIDYIDNVKFKDRVITIDGQRRREPPEHPNFSMKGRNPQSLIDQSDDWHYERERANRRETLLHRKSSKTVANYEWRPVNISNSSYKQNKENSFKFIQLTNYYALRDEGNDMRHCVGSYASYCASGRSTIFSLQSFVNGNFSSRVATIELNKTQIVQIRGRYNKKPDLSVQNVIKKWASDEILTISKYAL